MQQKAAKGKSWKREGENTSAYKCVCVWANSPLENALGYKPRLTFLLEEKQTTVQANSSYYQLAFPPLIILYFLKALVGKHCKTLLLIHKTIQKSVKTFLCTVWLRTNTEGEVSRRPGGLIWLMNWTTCCIHLMPFFPNPMTLRTHQCQLWTSS